jgi:hypothetical protein
MGKEQSKRPQPEEIVSGSTPSPPPPKSASIWEGSASWPFVPSGYLFVPEVFNRIGRSIFDEEWTCEEGGFRGSGPEICHPREVYAGETNIIQDAAAYGTGRRDACRLLGLDPDKPREQLTLAEWREARDRWNAVDARAAGIIRRRDTVIGRIHEEAEAGRLKFYLRHEGDMVPVRSSAWNCDAALVRQRIFSGLLNDAPKEYIGFFFGGREIWFFARADELGALIDGEGRANRNAFDPIEGNERQRKSAGGRPSPRRIALRIFRDRLARHVTCQSQKLEAAAIAAEWQGDLGPPSDRRIGEYLSGLHRCVRFNAGRVEPASAAKVIALVEAEIA